MANAVTRLLKENNKTGKDLNKENANVITDMVAYLNSDDITELDIQVMRRDITNMALEAQENNKDLKEVFGEDYKAFCDELIKESRHKTLRDKVIENLSIVNTAVVILTIINFIGDKIEAFINDKFTFDLTLNVRNTSLVFMIMVILMSIMIVKLVTKNSFQMSKKDTNIVSIKMFFTMFIPLSLAVIFKYIARTKVLFSINILYVLVICAMIFIALRRSENKSVYDLEKKYKSL